MAKKKKSADPVQDYRDALDEHQQAAGVEEQEVAAGKLARAKQALASRFVTTLGKFLGASNDNHLAELAGGGVTLSEALKTNKACLGIDASAAGMEAADQVSVIAEIEEADPAFVRELMRKVFQPKHEALLKNPVKVDSRDSAEFAKNALTLAERSGTRELIQFFSQKGVNEAHALNALITLQQQDPLGARNLTEQLPQDVQTGLLVGRLSIDDVRAIGLMGPEKLADQIRAQYDNDIDPSGGFTDRDNMTAVSLMASILEEKAELGGDQRDEALVMLKMLGMDRIRAILKFDYNKVRRARRGGDAEAAAAAKEVVRQFWRDHKTEMAEACRSYRERRQQQQEAAHAAPAAPAPTVDILAQDIDLDNL